jgi:hypothetical protein
MQPVEKIIEAFQAASEPDRTAILLELLRVRDTTTDPAEASDAQAIFDRLARPHLGWPPAENRRAS